MWLSSIHLKDENCEWEITIETFPSASGDIESDRWTMLHSDLNNGTARKNWRFSKSQTPAKIWYALRYLRNTEYVSQIMIRIQILEMVLPWQISVLLFKVPCPEKGSVVGAEGIFPKPANFLVGYRNLESSNLKNTLLVENLLFGITLVFGILD